MLNVKKLSNVNERHLTVLFIIQRPVLPMSPTNGPRKQNVEKCVFFQQLRGNQFEENSGLLAGQKKSFCISNDQEVDVEKITRERYFAGGRISFHFLTEEAAGQVLMVR